MKILQGLDNSLQPLLYLVSACLVGLKTRYDGAARASEPCLLRLAGVQWIPVCPEQLGGLSTPRLAADLVGGDGFAVLGGRAKVLRRDGVDVTEQFLLGAYQVLAIVEAQPVAGVILKSGSPSCGLSPLIGVTAALLSNRGITVEEI
ncbi:MAG: hypothetical protein A2511_14760 [Deltaproteobacteria bacterium RIFOXYD12_FULL_50_9]|nr:MAG: hypothetical protein A2511_14760 [Deltaproteobacteria bacterium RIFOXYD12_FULL_50_9]